METNQAPHDEPADDHLLEDLAAVTGLFNPEVIWHEKELLDEQDAAEEQLAQAGEEEPQANE